MPTIITARVTVGTLRFAHPTKPIDVAGEATENYRARRFPRTGSAASINVDAASPAVSM